MITTPGIPHTTDGVKYLRNTASYLKPGDIPLRPVALAIFKGRKDGEQALEESHAHCLPQRGSQDRRGSGVRAAAPRTPGRIGWVNRSASGKAARMAHVPSRCRKMSYCKLCPPPAVQIADPLILEVSASEPSSRRLSTGSFCRTAARSADAISSCSGGWLR